MSHALSREFETITRLVEYQYQSNEGIKWITMSLLGTLEVLDDYWETVENVDESEWERDFQGKIIDSIWETIHAWLVHNEIPMTEEERIAAEDQAVAELRTQLENLSEQIPGESARELDLEGFLNSLIVNEEDGDDKNGD